jgi:hypothetical protein
MNFKHVRVALGTMTLIAVAASAVGCDSNDDGTLQQSWTIAGGTDVNACTRLGASSMRLVVFDPGLIVQATRFAPCSDFQTSLPLNDDTYTGAATFLDVNGIAVSETRAIPAFHISEDETTRLSIDFPLEEFFRR